MSLKPQLRRAATLGGLVGVACAATVAFLPGTALADTYSCSNGTLYINGTSTGGSSASTSAGTVSCSGNRVLISFKPPPK